MKVASAEIRDDIIGFSRWMESVGWLEAEPQMKVKSKENPDGFDYAGMIQILEEPFLSLPLEPTRIQVRCDYPGSECGHMTTLRIPEQRTFLAFDLLYNRVHAWCGPGVDKPEIRNWIRSLSQIEREIVNDHRTFYCGHGSEGSPKLVSNMKSYLETFVEVTCPAANRQEASRK